MKTYVKPRLRYENFQLNQSVAGSCGPQPTGAATSTDATTCAYNDGALTYFTDAANGCVAVVDSPDAVQTNCYQTGTTNKTFNS